MAADVVTAARGLVERTCRAQGLPEHVEDESTLALVAAILVGPQRDDGAPNKGTATDVISMTTATATEAGGRVDAT